MFILKRLGFLFALAIIFSSCSEDFKVAAPYKTITLVYGLMNPGDTAHYIRIEKAFLDENKSAITMAQVADSSFYSNITVHLKELIGSIVLTDEILTRVDLNAEGYTKDTGAFFQSPNYAYKSKHTLTPGNTYRLVIKNQQTGQVDSSETAIIDNQASPPPQGFIINEFYSSYQLVFPSLHPSDQLKISTRGVPNNAKVFQAIIRFHWVDVDGSKETDHSADFTVGSTAWDGVSASVTMSTNQSAVYNFLRDNIGTAPINVKRYIDSCDLIVWAGSKDMYDYQQINDVQGGLTADEIKPIYTNIKSSVAGNALGLYTCRAMTQYHNVPINEQTLDSIETSSVTIGLNFQGRSDH